MSELVVPSLLWFCAIGSGIMGGVYFAFSFFITASFARIEQSEGIAAMQSINRVIVRSLFFPLFFGTTLASAALAVLALMQWEAPGSAIMFAGGLIYVVGMFVCTAAGNVPLNNALDAVDPQSDAAVPVWENYLEKWTRLNHVRTAACVIASILFVRVLMVS